MVASLLEYAVVLILGLIAGLLLRFFVALVFLLAGAVALTWLLGYVSAVQIWRGVSALERTLGGLGVAGVLLFSVVGIVFVVGMCGGVLLTSRLRAFDRPALV